MKKVMISLLVLLVLLTACKKENEIIDSPIDTPQESEIVEINTTDTIFAGKKSEQVKVETDSSGNVEKTTVSVILSEIKGEKNIEDFTDLSQIKNTKGGEEFVLQTNRLVFENLGEDIEYEGVSSKELPVSVKVSYFLDDKQVSPATIAGKSGKLRIRFDYENKTSVSKGSYTMPVPFMAMTMVLLPKDNFKNVELKNGKITQISGQIMAIGYALPTLASSLNISGNNLLKDIDIPEYFEITCDTNDCQIDLISTIFTNNVFAEISDEDIEKISKSTSDLDELKDASSKLANAGNQLIDAGKQLKNGLGQLTGNIPDIKQQLSAVQSFLDASELSEILKQLALALSAIDVPTIQNELSSLQQLCSCIEAEYSTLKRHIEEIEENYNALATVANSLTDSQLEQIARNQVQEKMNELDVDNQIQSEVLSVIDYSGITNELHKKSQAVLSSYDFNNIETLINSLTSNITSLQTEIDQQKYLYLLGAIGQLNNIFANSDLANLDSVFIGLNTLLDSVSSLSEGHGKYQSGVETYVSGVKQLTNDGINKLVNEMTHDLEDLSNRIKMLKEIDKSYDNFSGKTADEKAEVSFIFEMEGIKK